MMATLDNSTLEYMQSVPLWYLTHPYTVKDRNGNNNRSAEVENFKRVTKIAAELIKQGIKVYSPITHTHPIHLLGNFPPETYDLWIQLDSIFVERCDGIILCHGWEASNGCVMENKAFRKTNKPVITENILQEVGILIEDELIGLYEL